MVVNFEFQVVVVHDVGIIDVKGRIFFAKLPCSYHIIF